ncbi:hypothetical protein SAMN05660461_3532 [Chitinophaga ginsengisegetis]|uniref:Uncharacterized protein n=1 Tax=Chitinophaga ginsengisegetis TaxID=393003 RepID=A0A1T5P1V8_9BACT|nr:hypothetical protein [Chitinophaga ginsengisegetis]SKD06720.1 hypothetical protein SAMN05660461_3532 [Chitinophaga ginsengisegetis]
MQDIFNTRELALFTWIIPFFLWIMMKSSNRRMLFDMVILAIGRSFWVIYGLMIVYVMAVIGIMSKIGIWDAGQIKNTIFWFISAGLVSLYSINKIREDKGYYVDAIKDVFKFTAFVEFLIGFHTFNYWIEIFILPVVTFLVLLAVFAKRDRKNTLVAKFANGLLSIIGLFLIIYALYWIIAHFESFASKGTLSDFLVPSLLSLFFLPFVFLLSVYVSYEMAFVGLRVALQDSGLYSFAKKMAIFHFKFRVKDFVRWKNSLFIHTIQTKEELILSLKKMKELNKIEANPPNVDISMGWSPYKAKDLLKEGGVETGFYNDCGDGEWQAASNLIYLNDNEIISSCISYYVMGSNEVANQLKLMLAVHYPESAMVAHKRMLDLAELLHREAMGSNLPEELKRSIRIGLNFTLSDGNRKISVSRQAWEEHKLGGYHLISILEVDSP